MSEWKEYKLGDVIQVGNGKERPKTKGMIPVFGGNGILDYCDKVNYENETIIIGRVGAYCGSVFFENKPIWVSDNALAAKSKNGFDTKYLFYFLKNLNLNEYAEGSSHPLITQSLLNSIDVNITDNLSEQFTIVQLLSSLDDKIDLLHRQNATLEKMAETLFRQWFVEEAKVDWEVGRLADLITVKYGKDHKNLIEGNIPVFGSGGVMRYAEKALYDKESVLIPRKGSLGNVTYINEPFWTVDTMFYTEIKKPNCAKLLYHFIKNLDLASMNVGSAVPSMTTEVLNNIPIVVPTDDFFEKFEKTVAPFYTKMKINQTQIRTLTTLRDTLLPKLMRGEVRVKM